MRVIQKITAEILNILMELSMEISYLKKIRLKLKPKYLELDMICSGLREY